MDLYKLNNFYWTLQFYKQMQNRESSYQTSLCQSVNCCDSGSSTDYKNMRKVCIKSITENEVWGHIHNSKDYVPVIRDMICS